MVYILSINRHFSEVLNEPILSINYCSEFQIQIQGLHDNWFAIIVLYIILFLFENYL